MARLILVIAVCATLCVGASWAQEMLSNPTFEPNEDGTAPRDWYYQDWNTDGRPLYDPTGGRDGSPAAGIECDTTLDRGCWMERLPLEGRKHLHVSAYYRTEGIARGDNAKIRVEWWDADGGFIQGTRLWLEPAEDWTYFEAVVTAPEGAATVAPELFNRFGVGRVWWDRAHLREARTEELLRFDDTPARPEEWGFRPSQDETAAVNPPSFVWRPQHAAIAYEVQVVRDEAFEQIAYSARIDEYTAHRPPRVLDPGTYLWRVRFIDHEERESAWSVARRFTIPDDAAQFPMPTREEMMARVPEGHPRLFIRPEEIAWLRELAQGPLSERYDELVARSERFLESPPPTEDYQKYPEGMERLSPEWARIWRGARSYVERPLTGICTLALVWHLGGPEEYAQAAREMLMEIAQWDPVGATGYRYNDEAGMRYAWGFSRAYTLLHDVLSEEEREICREVMQVRGREMYGHMHTQRQHLWNPYSSHPNRAYHWLGEIGLAFHGEIPEAEEWAWFATNIFFHVYPVWSDPDGGWHEGISYWHGYLTRITQWLDVMRATLQIDGYRKPFFSQVGYFPIYAQPPNAPRITFGDTTGVRGPQDVRPVMTQFAQQTGNPFWADYLDRIGGPIDQPDWLGFIRTARAHDRPPIAARSIAELPSARLFEGTGLAYLHTDLTDARNDVMVAFKSSPFGSWSHGNEPQNSFELHAYGDPLLVRSGTREIHGSPHHRDWTWRTHSANAITVNGQGQIPHTASARGRITQFVHSEGFDYVVGDALEAYPRGLVTRADRHILFVRPDLVVVYDDLTAPEPATFQYYLHAPFEFEHQSGASFEAGGELGRCRVDLVAPEGLEVTLFEGYDPPIRPPYDEQIHEYHLKAETVEASERGEFITLLRTGRAGETLPFGADHIETAAGHALRMPLADGSAIVLLRTGGEGELAAWGLSTDGTVAAVRLGADGRPRDVFGVGGDEVRWQGEPVGGG
ncbi:MAG: DUF4962 domain-containing protein [Armatimonadota bacterium]